jgi:hypothetical protein
MATNPQRKKSGIRNGVAHLRLDDKSKRQPALCAEAANLPFGCTIVRPRSRQRAALQEQRPPDQDVHAAHQRMPAMTADTDYDKALKDSFPASDAPANSGITGAGDTDKKPTQETKVPKDGVRETAGSSADGQAATDKKTTDR